MKMTKKTEKNVLITILCLLIAAFIAYTVSYSQNAKMMRNVGMGKPSIDDMPTLNFICSYRYHYNKGNIYYLFGEYDMAIMEYEKALKSNNIPRNKECKIRINEALAIVAPLAPEKVTADNVDKVLEQLYWARDILCEKGCASLNDDYSGHNADAQQLKNEIQAYIDLLENPPPSSSSSQDPDDNQDPNGGGGSGDQDDPDNPDNQNNGGSGDGDGQNDPSEGESIEDQLKDIQRQGTEERNRSVEQADSWAHDEFGSNFGVKNW